MRIALLSCLLVGVLIQRSYSEITAVESDLVVDCGTDVGGPVSVTYTNADVTNNNVVKLSSPKNKATCSATGTGGVFTISDVRTNCDITQPDTTKPIYWLQVTLQEFDGIYRSSDPTFLFQCSYSADKVTLTNTAVNNAGGIGTPTSVILETAGQPDMKYSLEIVDTTQTLQTDAKFGDIVFLRVKMNDTDGDEQGVRVESCTVTSGAVTKPLIQNSCVVPELSSLFTLQGFASNGLEASFPITLFALEGSDSNSLEFQCVVDVCPSNCNGLNCVTTGRKRRAAGEEETEEKYLKMGTKIQVLPIAVPTSNNLNQSGEQEDGSATCMQSLGFIVTVAVLAVLLLVALVTVVFMFTTRRRELQKQGA